MNFLKNVCYDYLGTYSCDLTLCMLRKVEGLAMSPFQVIIHESGHAIAAHILLKNANTKIELKNYGYSGGMCYFYGEEGEWLGKSNAIAVIAAAGPVVDMVTSLALLRLFPGNIYSCRTLLKTALYALSALSEKAFYTNKEEDYNPHDFVRVKINIGGLAANTLIISCVAAAIFGCYSMISQGLLIELIIQGLLASIV